MKRSLEFVIFYCIIAIQLALIVPHGATVRIPCDALVVRRRSHGHYERLQKQIETSVLSIDLVPFACENYRLIPGVKVYNICRGPKNRNTCLGSTHVVMNILMLVKPLAPNALPMKTWDHLVYPINDSSIPSLGAAYVAAKQCLSSQRQGIRLANDKQENTANNARPKGLSPGPRPQDWWWLSRPA